MRANAFLLSAVLGLLGLTDSLLAQSTIVILSPANGFIDNGIEPGVSLQRTVDGMGPLNGVDLQFSCGSCDVATFEDAVARIGGGASLCGYQSRLPRQIVQNDDLLCIRSTITGNRYDLDLVTWSTDKGQCIDADGGDSCYTVGYWTSYVRAPAPPATPADLLEQLIQDVLWLDLHRGTEKSLLKKLNGAAKKLNKNAAAKKLNKNAAAAVNKLEAFINKVKAQSGKKIHQENAYELMDAANEIITLLEGV